MHSRVIARLWYVYDWEACMRISQELTLKRVWIFFAPLALSGLMMALGQPIVHAGLARLQDPEVTLAAYGLTFYAAVLLEAPIIMLLPAANALVSDKIAYYRTRRWMLIFNLILTINALVISCITPLYDFIFMNLMGFPADVARTAQPGLIVLVFWPAVIGIRRFYQGLVIRFGQTHWVGWGSAARLIAMLITIILGVKWFPHHGIIVGSASLMAGVIADCVVAVIGAHRLLASGVLPAESPEALPASRQLRPFLNFFLPLAVTSCLMVLSRPLILSGIARSHEPRLALAAWPVALGSMHLVSGQLQMIQQAVVALVRDRSGLEVVKRFTIYAALCFFAILILLAVTPGADYYHRVVIGLEEPILSMTNNAFRIMVFMPLLMAAQAWNQGMLIRAGRTMAVNFAAFANLILVVSLVFLVAITTRYGGHMIAATFLPLALLGEVLLLARWARPVIRDLVRKVPDATVTAD